jgi:hypothetical protein
MIFIAHLDIWNTSYSIKKKVGSQISSLTPNNKKSKIDPIYLFAEGVRHIFGKLSTRIITLLQIASRRRSTRKVMALQSRGSLNLGVPGQKTIWMWAPWLATKYTIRGKVLASPKCVHVARGSF